MSHYKAILPAVESATHRAGTAGDGKVELVHLTSTVDGKWSAWTRTTWCRQSPPLQFRCLWTTTSGRLWRYSDIGVEFIVAWSTLSEVACDWKCRTGKSAWLIGASVYDTIRDAVLTCTRKPTWVGLTCHMKPTTKNCKTEKLKSKSRYVRTKSLGNHVVSSEEEKERLQWEGFGKKVLSLEWKREWVMKNNNNNN